ncbi:NADH-dependent flavin oxidoreductase, partial [candidate division GN15 bacterium]|nr:NADH-dependent flavin oxidoreductase [candidate division GN15 bacterium]
ANAAGRARRAGFDAIEIHGANTYLFQQFFSPFTNRRDDEWGCQSFDNRSRFAREAVKAVRSEVGEDYPIAYRISPEEEDPDGYSTSEAIELLKVLVDAGVDIVHVSSWKYGTGVRNDWPDDSHPTKLIRDALPARVPVIGVGGVGNAGDALRVLEDNVELIAIGRALLLDADWARKIKDGDDGSIRSSIATEDELQALEIPDRMRDYIRRWVFEAS